ncbi:hypothetical protein [Deinococcus planocerae]|uniref:hypothetical protein n=1 Tax=Deinococcus planocerae TaxID=1737569 RepID=UPI000C7ECB46|nr:hypothetical protein [Deinococcus planocerae]
MTPTKARARASLLLTLGFLTLALHFAVDDLWRADVAAGFLLGIAVMCLVAGVALTGWGRRRG